MSLPPKILDALRAAGFVRGTNPQVIALAGGVSCDIWRVADGDRVFAVKRALPRLRVQAEWYADVSRNQHEQNYLRYVGGFLPGAVPRILPCVSARDFFVMEYLDGAFTDWKSALLAGKVEPGVALAAGKTLGRIHRESWMDASVQRVFATDRNFHDLRIAPYLLSTAEKHPDLSEGIRREAERLAATKLALVHGDYSPKNLMVAPGRLVVLDCEVAWFGDPGFDLCFLINHLLLKSLHCTELAGELFGLTEQALSAYRAELGEEKFLVVAQGSPALLLCLLLARVDGKSPVEYLQANDKKDFVRAFVRRHLSDPSIGLPALLDDWKATLPT